LQLHLSLDRKIPIGLIASSWGGCAIEPWMRGCSLAKCDQNLNGIPNGISKGISDGGANGGMFNAMMQPFENRNDTTNQPLLVLPRTFFCEISCDLGVLFGQIACNLWVFV